MELILIIVIALFFLWGAVAITGGFYLLSRVVRALEKERVTQPHNPVGT